MRRKKKKNVFTSHTLKFCPNCTPFCFTCKGVCKAELENGVDPAMVPDNHLIAKKKRKSQKFGIGSLRSGRTFVRSHLGRHRCYSWMGNEYEIRINKNRRIRREIEEQLVMYRIESL
jgi:hypothetical protein